MGCRSLGGHRSGVPDVGGTSGLGASEGVVDDAAQVVSGPHVLIAAVDVLKGVSPGNEFSELQSPLSIQLQQSRDISRGTRGAEERTLEPLLKEDQVPQGDGERNVVGGSREDQS